MFDLFLKDAVSGMNHQATGFQVILSPGSGVQQSSWASRLNSRKPRLTGLRSHVLFRQVSMNSHRRRREREEGTIVISPLQKRTGFPRPNPNDNITLEDLPARGQDSSFSG